MQNAAGEWVSYTEVQIRRELRIFGVRSGIPEGMTASPMDAALSHLNRERDVHYAAPLAGHPTGLLKIEGQRILVTEGPRWIEPRKGEWPILKHILGAMFPSERGIGDIQLKTFLLWLKIAHESLQTGTFQPGQALCIAGPVECGKSLVQSAVITPLFGGRMARPYAFMSGVTHFNAELFAAEHLAIDDEQASFDLRARRAFAATLKQFSVADGQRCERKFQTPILLRPFWRVSITVNDEPEALGVLPPLTPDLADKLILLRARKAPMPMPTRAPAERAAFAAAVRAELPALLWDLECMTVPEELCSERFGVRHFHYPALREALAELSPEARLAELMDALFFADVEAEPWTGTARDLEQTLRRESATMREAERLFSFPHACGTYLGRLAALTAGPLERARAS